MYQLVGLFEGQRVNSQCRMLFCHGNKNATLAGSCNRQMRIKRRSSHFLFQSTLGERLRCKMKDLTLFYFQGTGKLQSQRSAHHPSPACGTATHQISYNISRCKMKDLSLSLLPVQYHFVLANTDMIKYFLANLEIALRIFNVLYANLGFIENIMAFIFIRIEKSPFKNLNRYFLKYL